MRGTRYGSVVMRAILLGLFIAGCGKKKATNPVPDDFYPMAVGNRWDYLRTDEFGLDPRSLNIQLTRTAIQEGRGGFEMVTSAPESTSLFLGKLGDSVYTVPLGQTYTQRSILVINTRIKLANPWVAYQVSDQSGTYDVLAEHQGYFANYIIDTLTFQDCIVIKYKPSDAPAVELGTRVWGNHKGLVYASIKRTKQTPVLIYRLVSFTPG